MNHLFIKLHYNYLAWLINPEKYGVVPVSGNLINTCANIQPHLPDCVVDKVYIEDPFVVKEDVGKLIRIQRTLGALLWLIFQKYNTTPILISQADARMKLFGTLKIGKDLAVTEAQALLKGLNSKDIGIVATMCVYDALVLRDYIGGN